MNTRFYFLSLLLIASTNLATAKVIRVDNNTDASADYVKLQDAINNANQGDSIYVVGSPFIYDTDNRRTVEIRLNKQVTIIGPGYFLGENTNTQFNKQTAKIQAMNIGEGANGAVIIGFVFNGDINVNMQRLDRSQGSNAPDGVTVARNTISRLLVYNGSNILIAQNYLTGYYGTVYLDRNASRTIIRNNISVSNRNPIYGDGGEFPNTLIANNTLSNSIYRINGATVQNNIFVAGGFNDCDNNNVKNNIFTTVREAAFPENSTGNDASDNVFGAVQANLFVSPELSLDVDYRLAEQSPAKGIGIEGQDAGAYGGTDPYRVSGLPAIPAIYDLTTSGVGTPAGGMSVTIQVKSNN